MAYDAASLGNQFYPVTWPYPLRKPQNPHRNACESENILQSLRLLISYVSRGEGDVFSFFYFPFSTLYRSIYTLHTNFSF